MTRQVDTGMARERTALAWQRTAVAFAAVAALGVVAGRSLATSWLATPGSTVALAGAIGSWRQGRRACMRRLGGRPSSLSGPLRAVALAVTLSASAAIVATLAH